MPNLPNVLSDGRINPGGREETPFERRSRVRAAYGLESKAPTADDVLREAEKVAGGPVELEKVLAESLKFDPSEPGFDAERKTAQFLNDIQDESGIHLFDSELQEIWKDKRYTSWEDAFEDVRKATSKRMRQEAIGPGAMASTPGHYASSPDKESAAAELDKIQRGPEPSSPKHRARRAELRRILRG